MTKEALPPPQTIEVGKAIIINKQGEIFLVQRAADDSWRPLYWEIPGGKSEPGEEPETTVVRETQEETGITIEVVSKLHLEEMVLTEGNRKGNVYKIHSYLCRAIGGGLILSNEHQDHMWAAVEKALSLNLTDPTHNALVALSKHSNLQNFP